VSRKERKADFLSFLFFALSAPSARNFVSRKERKERKADFLSFLFFALSAPFARNKSALFAPLSKFYLQL